MYTAFAGKHPDSRWTVTIICVAYLIAIQLFTGLRIENIALAAGYCLLIWITPQTRSFALAFAIFIVFGLSYDLMKYWPNYLFREVDISRLYFFEKSLFGITTDGITQTPNEYLALVSNKFLDFLCGLIYLNWVPVPLAYAVYLYFKKREVYLDYGLAFLLVNFIGFAGYYIHPAAPPWYIELHGFQFIADTSGNAAGLSRFDNLIGVPVFSAIYSKNSNVFAALPSLHCAYPVVMLYYGIRNNHKGIRSVISVLMILFMAGIWFSAVYSWHHYVVDVILGVLCAIAGLIIYEVLLLKSSWFVKFKLKYYVLIK